MKRALVLLAALLIGVCAALVALSAARAGLYDVARLARAVPRRTVARKLTEVFLALRMERTLSKRRIFELYLNLIEQGDGVFGAEAAARRYFGVSAADLSPRQALLLAAVIVNPHRCPVLHPPRRIERRVRMIASRMRRRGALDQAQYEQALGLPPPAPPDSTAPQGDPLSPPATP